MLFSKMGGAMAAGCLLALLLGSCSLTRTKAECESAAECREAFGPGYVCVENHLCQEAKVEPSCLGQSPGDLLISPEQYKDYVVLGSLLRSEGKEGARHDSALLALDAVNNFLEDHEDDFPALEGLRFGMVQCTHDGDVNEVARLATYLVDTLGTPAILGPASSSNTKAAFEHVNISDEGEELRRAVFISPSATSVALSALEVRRPGFLWRTAPTDDGQGKLMGKYIKDNGLPYIALYEDTPYGRGLYEELQATTKNACSSCGFSFDGSDKRIDPLATTLAGNRVLSVLAEAQVIFFMGAQESHLKEMIRRLGDSEYEDKILFFSDAGASADTVNSVSINDIDRVIGTRPRAPEESEGLRVFQSIYEARHDESPLIHSFTSNSYDATWLLLVSALRAKVRGDAITPENIAKGLTELSDPEWTERKERDCTSSYDEGSGACLPVTLDATRLPVILEAFERFGSLDVRGASGELDYDEEDEELVADDMTFEIWHLEPALGDDINYTITSGEGP